MDKIYRGMLRFGRPEPDYRRTDALSVVLRLATVDADEAFLKLVVGEEGRRGTALPIDSLIALAALRELKRLTTEELALHIQRDPAQARRTLELLLEAGLAQAHGATRARTYTLAPGVYQADGDKAAYTRQAGFSALQHAQLILNYVRQHGSIRRSEVMQLCRLSDDQAWRVLKRLLDDGKLAKQGERRWTVYTLAPGV